MLNRQIARQDGTHGQILDLFEMRGGDFSEVNYATALNWLAKKQPRAGYVADAPRVASLLSTTRLRLEANGAAWDAGHGERRARQRLLGHGDGGFEATPRFWDGAAAEAARIMDAPATQPQNLANICWAFAKSGCGSPDAVDALFAAVGRSAVRRVDEFNAQELGNTAWAYATAGRDHPALFDAIAASAMPRVDRFIAQNLANTVWAYATAGHARPDLFDAVAREVARRADEFKPQELANTAWAYATAHKALPGDRPTKHRQLFDALADSADHRLRDFNNQGLSNLAWAYASAGASDGNEALFEALGLQVSLRVAEFRPQGLANLVWAYATAELYCPEVFEAVADEIARPSGGARRAFEFNPQEVANTVWAFAKAAELANLAWAYACADHVDGDLLLLLWRAIVKEARESPDPALDGSRFNLEELRQLQQVVLHGARRGTTMGGLVAEIAAAPAFVGLLASLAAASPSRAQVEVAERLEGMGLDVEHELRVPTGRTRFKMRLLRALGWRVLHVPYFDWAKLDDDAARTEYLKRELAVIVKAAKAAKARPPPATAEPRDDRDEFSALKVSELRQLCDDRGLDTRVKRAEATRARQ
ncbi:hypothetical protein JL722_404 [Aureococcus anophagefferens]|nr:hypothetical protein JL722_404 [Aureococcus anophagefferens]